MDIEFKIFHESKKPENAKKAIQRMKNHNNCDFSIVSVEPYLNKGCLAWCKTSIHAKNWEELTYKVILFAQSFGYGWYISGRINEELNLWSTGFSCGVGVTAADISISRESFNIIKEERNNDHQGKSSPSTGASA